MKRLIILVFSSAPIVFSALFMHPSLAPAQDRQAPHETVICPTTDQHALVLNSPKMLDFHWTENVCPPGTDFYYWEILKGPSPENLKVAYLSMNVEETFFRDEAVQPGQTWYYKYDGACTSPGTVPKVASYRPDIPSEDPFSVTIGDAWCGSIYEDYSIGGGDVLLSSLTAKAGATLSIEGAEVSPAAPPGWISAEDGAHLQITASDLLNVNISLAEGQVSGNTFSPGRVATNGSGSQSVEISGNTFSAQACPGSWLVDYQCDIRVAGSHKATITGNRGKFFMELDGHSNAEVGGNIFTGYVDVLNEAQATLADNEITGGVHVSGSDAAPGKQAEARLFKNTIILTTTVPQHPWALDARAGSRLIAANTSLEDRYLLAVPQAASVRSAAQLILSNSPRIDGQLQIMDDARLESNESNFNSNVIALSDDATGSMARNLIIGQLYLSGNARLDLAENVILRGKTSGITIGDQAWGTFLNNTVRVGATHTALNVSTTRDNPELKIEDNCLESGTGLSESGSRTTPLKVENNWWGDASGPYHVTLNPTGVGAKVLGDQVDFDPYLTVPTPCKDAPPHAPVIASGLVTAEGSRFYVPDGKARLEFPAGAVGEPIVVTYVAPVASPIKASLIDSLLPMRLFELSAVISGTTTPVVSFNTPFTLTLDYSQDELKAVNESTLKLYWWDGQAWRAEPSGIVYPAVNRLIATLNHMTLFGVLGESQGRLYLPVIRN